jgi:flagellar motor component MotA
MTVMTGGDMSDLREKLDVLIELAPKLRAAGVLRVETDEIDFRLAPAEPQPRPAALVDDDKEEDGYDATDLRPRALRERDTNKRGY